MAMIDIHSLAPARPNLDEVPLDEVAASLLARALELAAEGADEIDAVAELVVDAGSRRLSLLAAYSLAERLVDHLPGDDQAYLAFHWLGRGLHWHARLRNSD